ncbi:hypothetical protein PG984_014197 [Apiospora sp. TS-2023a]
MPPRSSTRKAKKKASWKEASPTTLFHLVPTNSSSRSALHGNTKSVSRARNGQDGIEIGYHVPLKASGRIITSLGRGGDIQLGQITPRRPLSVMHAYFEYWPKDFQILLINRSRQKGSVACVPIDSAGKEEPKRSSEDVVIEWNQDYRLTIASYEFLLVWYVTDETKAKIAASQGWEKSMFEVSQRPSNDRPTEYNIGLGDARFHNTRLSTGNHFREVGPREFLNEGSYGTIVYKTKGVKDPTDTKDPKTRNGMGNPKGAGGQNCPGNSEDLEETRGQKLICYAVKVISVGNNHTLAQAANIHTEANMMRRFNHVNIIKILFTHNFDTAKPEIAMPLMDGSLDDLINCAGLYNQQQWHEIGEWIAGQILSGLKYLAERRVVHRDIKPANILYRKGRHDRYLFQLADLSLAKHCKNALEPGGTASYQAPELYPEISGVQGKLGPKMDIYSLTALEKLPGLVRGKGMLESMAERNPENRPSANELLRNYFKDKDMGIPYEVNSESWENSSGDEEEKEGANNSSADVEMADPDIPDIEMEDVVDPLPSPTDQFLQQLSSSQNGSGILSRRHSTAGRLCEKLESLSLLDPNPNPGNDRVCKTPRGGKTPKGARTPRTPHPNTAQVSRAAHAMVTRKRQALLESIIFTERAAMLQPKDDAPNVAMAY